MRPSPRTDCLVLPPHLGTTTRIQTSICGLNAVRSGRKCKAMRLFKRLLKEIEHLDDEDVVIIPAWQLVFLGVYRESEEAVAADRFREAGERLMGMTLREEATDAHKWMSTRHLFISFQHTLDGDECLVRFNADLPWHRIVKLFRDLKEPW